MSASSSPAGFLNDPLPRGSSLAVHGACFGKHPAWEDHMDDIGLNTGSLVALKQMLYVEGISENLGRWRQWREAGQGLVFDHDFLWVRNDQALIGSMVESVDGKGRTLFPLVLVCHLQGGTLTSMLDVLSAYMRESIVKVRQAQTREAVERFVKGMDARLASLTFPGSAFSESDRAGFLDAEVMGPEYQGFQRILHVALAAWEFADHQSVHIRVPVIEPSTSRAFLLWKAFVSAISETSPPVLLFRHQSADFVDIIAGPPRSSDFQCLCADKSDLGLVTSVPFRISDRVSQKKDQIFATFRDGKTPPPKKKDPSGAFRLWQRIKGD